LENAPFDPRGANTNRRLVNSTTAWIMIDTGASTAEPRVFSSESDAKVDSPHCYTTRLSNHHLGNFNIMFFDGRWASYPVSTLMDSPGKNIATSPVILSPWDPDAQ
jgi:hypothetical protein